MTILGIDCFRNSEVAVSEKRRQASHYVCGVPGAGKSSYLEGLIHSDIAKGYPVIVFDPAKDLIDHIISQLPEDKLKKTFLLDLHDESHSFGINIFALSKNELSDTKQRQMAIDRVLRIMEKLFPGESRMLLEKVLLFLTHVFVDAGRSLADVPRFFYDDAFRNQLVKKTSSRRAKEYWLTEYNHMSPSARSKLTTPLLNRIPTLLANPMFEAIVGQQTTTIDFRQSINQCEILLIRLPVNEFTHVAPLVGTLLISELYRSTFSFFDTALADRRGFSVFIDEFQNFSSSSDIAELISQARKLGMRLTIAHQYREQLSDDTKAAVLTAGVLTSFRVVHKDALEMASSFCDQAATIHERAILPDVLKHVPLHPVEAVQQFYRSHIQPLQLKAKEPCIGLPPSLQRMAPLQTNADLLTYLEKLMYLVQKQGRIFEEEGDTTVVEKMYFDYVGISAYRLGFHNYYLSTFKKVYNGFHPNKKAVEEQAL